MAVINLFVWIGLGFSVFLIFRLGNEIFGPGRATRLLLENGWFFVGKEVDVNVAEEEGAVVLGAEGDARRVDAGFDLSTQTLDVDQGDLLQVGVVFFNL